MMRWVYKLPLRLRSVFRKSRVEQELTEELRFHLERLIEERVAKGMTAEDVRYAALRELGGVEQIKEECRDMRRVNYIENLLQDLRLGLRQLRQSPGFTAVAVLTLALGIGTNTAIFSVVNAVLLRPLPYKDPARLVTFVMSVPGAGKAPWVDPHLFAELRQQKQVFEETAAYDWSDLTLTGRGEAERVTRVAVTASLFPLLDLHPILGRAFLAEDEKPERNNVALLSHDLWQRRFGSDRNLVGHTVTLGGHVFTVIGIMPGGLKLPVGGDLWAPKVWIPMTLDLAALTQHLAVVIGRRKAGVTVGRIQGDLDVFVDRLNQSYSAQKPLGSPPEPRITVRAVSLQEATVGDTRPALLILLGAVGLVLLIACANVANLLLSRMAGRQREMAVRTAVGASRGRLIRQLLTESLLLALSASGLGLALAGLGLHTLLALAPPNTPRIDTVAIDRWVLCFTLVISALAAVLFGMAPALHASKPDLNESLKEGSRRSAGGFGRYGVRNLLVAGETALVLMILVGAGLLLRSFLRLTQVNLGFNPQNVLTMQLGLPELRYQDHSHKVGFELRLLEALKALPGVSSAGVTFSLPFGDPSYCGLTFANLSGSQTQPGNDALFLCHSAGPGYFQTMGIPVLEGRDFNERDTEAKPGVAIVNEALARGVWPGHTAIGRRISSGGPGDHWLSIVGVVGNVREEGLAAEPRPAVYMDFQGPSPLLTVVVRTASDPIALAPAVRQQVWALDQEVSINDIQTMDEMVSGSLLEPRFNALLLGTFAALALILACVGIYAVMSYFVTQRRHEIGIRMALGAGQHNILRLVLLRSLATTLVGIGIGVTGALALGRVVSGLLYAVRPTDPATLASASLLLGGVGVLASYLPARRATNVDPMIILRYE